MHVEEAKGFQQPSKQRKTKRNTEEGEKETWSQGTAEL